jgi:hypothetical protein
MKHRIKFILVLGTIIVFFYCCKDDPVSSEPIQTDQVTMFSGAEEYIAMHNPGIWTPQPSGLSLAEGGVYEYRDEATDPRVTGKVMFYVNGLFDSTFSGTFSGTGELITDNGGSWDMKIVGERIAAEGSFAEAIGHGKGELEGLIAYWSYERFEPEKDNFIFEGYIIEAKED